MTTYTSVFEGENTAAALNAGRQIGRLELAGEIHRDGVGVPFLIKPAGFEVTGIEHLLAAPASTRAIVNLADAVSFIAYVNRFKDPGTLVFASLDQRRFDAVLDYHKPEANGARWGKHRASYVCATTPDWKRWSDQNAKPMDQLTFARFIEDGIPNIATPAGATLLEICLTLEAKTGVSFRSHQRLSNGQHQFRYEEEIEGKAGAQSGSLDIPDSFTLVLEPFPGVGGKQIEARFRYRINSGELKLWFELVRPEDVLKAAFDEIVALVESGVGDVPVLAGAAPEVK